MAERIIEIIKEIRPYEIVDANTELIESGILDSLAIFQLVTLLEDEFEIEIADEAVTAENFSTVNCILLLIETYEHSREEKVGI